MWRDHPWDQLIVAPLNSEAGSSSAYAEQTLAYLACIPSELNATIRR